MNEVNKYSKLVNAPNVYEEWTTLSVANIYKIITHLDFHQRL